MKKSPMRWRYLSPTVRRSPATIRPNRAVRRHAAVQRQARSDDAEEQGAEVAQGEGAELTLR